MRHIDLYRKLHERERGLYIAGEYPDMDKFTEGKSFRPEYWDFDNFANGEECEVMVLLKDKWIPAVMDVDDFNRLYPAAHYEEAQR